MSNQPAIKFRPSLSSQQISYLVDILKQQPSSPTQQEILSSLHKFSLKAQHGIVSASHVSLNQKKDLVSDLGFGPSPADSLTDEFLLSVYQSAPATLSTSQLARVQLYRYTNDLMTPEEESQYESSQLSAT